MSHIISFSESVDLINRFVSAYDPISNNLPIGGVLSRSAFIQGLSQLPSSPDTPGVRAWLCKKEVGMYNRIFIATESVNVDDRSPGGATMLSSQNACDDSAYIYLPGNQTVQNFLQNEQSPSPDDIALTSTQTTSYKGKFISQFSPLNPQAVAFMERKDCEDLADQNSTSVWINYFFGHDEEDTPNSIRLIYFAVNSGNALRLTGVNDLILERSNP